MKISKSLFPAAVAGSLLLLVAGCSSMPKMPSSFINPLNRLTAEEGRRLMQAGELVVENAEADIKRGKQLVKDGRKRRDVGEEEIARGRQLLRSAAMAEEAERLARQAANLKGEALTQ